MQVSRLKEWREHRFLTQRELAAAAGTTAATVNRLERGRHAARISTVRKLAAALRVDPAKLLETPGTRGGQR